MQTNVIVIDDFYKDPMTVRNFALSQEFTVTGNYPGARTKDFRNDEMKQVFEQILGKKITDWNLQYSGSFQYTTAQNHSWVHYDVTDYAVIVYLTPNAPPSGGTAFFRHKETGISRFNEPGFTAEQFKKVNSQGGDLNLWDRVDTCGNKFNRAVLFNGRRYHSSDVYFGNSKEDGRLFQLFFFNVEK